MKVLILAVLALAILGGGGAVGYFYFYQPAQASIGEEADGDHGAAAAQSHKKDGGDGHGPAISFVHLDPIHLPIVDNDGVSEVISLVVAIEVADESAAKNIETMAPKLTDAIIQDMYGVLSRRAVMKDGVLLVGALKARLKRVTEHILGEEAEHDILLQVVSQRPI